METEQLILKKLDGLRKWQTDHEIADERRHKELPEMVKQAVEIQINGHLREIKCHLNDQDIKLDNLKVETAPIIESKNTIISIRKFLLYFAAPMGIAYAVWQYLIDKIK